MQPYNNAGWHQAREVSLEAMQQARGPLTTLQPNDTNIPPSPSRLTRQKPLSSQIIQEPLAMPMSVCLEHMPELAVDGGTVSIFMLVRQVDRLEKCLSMGREQVQLKFRKGDANVPIVGAESSSYLGKRIRSWSIKTSANAATEGIQCSARPPARHDFYAPPVTTSKMIVLEVQFEREPGVPGSRVGGRALLAAKPVVPGTPLFTCIKRSGATCAACGNGSHNDVWSQGWLVPVNMGLHHAEVNLCHRCGPVYRKMPGRFEEHIARTSGPMYGLAQKSNPRGCDQEQQIMSKAWYERMEQARAVLVSHGTAGHAYVKEEQKQQKQEHQQEPQPDVAMYVDQHYVPAGGVPLFMGEDYQGQTWCTCCARQDGSRWVSGWPLPHVQPQTSACHEQEDITAQHANLCQDCGDAYAANPEGFLASYAAATGEARAKPWSAEATTHVTTEDSEECVWLERATRKRRPSSRLGDNIEEPYLQNLKARNELRMQQKAISHQTGVTDATQTRYPTMNGQPVCQVMSSGGAYGPIMTYNGQWAPNGGANVVHIPAPEISTAAAAPNTAGASRNQQQVHEILISSSTKLIVPDALVQRDFQMALNGGECYVRLAFLYNDTYVESTQEWVRLKEHPVTKQVNVEGESLLPLHGKVMAGWRSRDPHLVPGQQPIKGNGKLYWKDANTSQLLPLSTDKVLLMQTRDPKAREIEPAVQGSGSAAEPAEAQAAVEAVVWQHDPETGTWQQVPHTGTGWQQGGVVITGQQAGERGTWQQNGVTVVGQQGDGTGTWEQAVMGPQTSETAAWPQGAVTVVGQQGGEGVTWPQGAVMVIGQRDGQAGAWQPTHNNGMWQPAGMAGAWQQGGEGVTVLHIPAEQCLGALGKEGQQPISRHELLQQYTIKQAAHATDGDDSEDAAAALLDLSRQMIICEAEAEDDKQRLSNGNQISIQAGGHGIDVSQEADDQQPFHVPSTTTAAAVQQPSAAIQACDNIRHAAPAVTTVIIDEDCVMMIPEKQAPPATAPVVRLHAAIAESKASQSAVPAAACTLALATNPHQGKAPITAPMLDLSIAGRQPAMSYKAISPMPPCAGSTSIPPQAATAAFTGPLAPVGNVTNSSVANQGNQGSAQPCAPITVVSQRAPLPASPGTHGHGVEGVKKDVLDVLRPMVLQLIEHGGPSVSAMWTAVQALTVEQVEKFQRHALPYIQGLWADKEWQECAQVIKRTLKLA